MNSDWTIPLVFQLAGIVVLMAEVLLPSGGILAVIAAGLLGYAVYLAFTTVSSDAGFTLIVVDILLLPIAAFAGFKLLARSPLALQTSLRKSEGVVSYDEKLSELVGREGVAVTNLRPSGTIKIENRRIDVVTRGDFIEKGEAVVVSKVEGSRVIVRKKQAAL
ncbi:MAG: NfeD family protein [Desulfosalsimonadaceae bacterium]